GGGGGGGGGGGPGNRGGAWVEHRVSSGGGGGGRPSRPRRKACGPWRGRCRRTVSPKRIRSATPRCPLSSGRVPSRQVFKSSRHRLHTAPDLMTLRPDDLPLPTGVR